MLLHGTLNLDLSHYKPVREDVQTNQHKLKHLCGGLKAFSSEGSLHQHGN